MQVTLALHRQGIIKGLFLSSTIERDPDFTVERQIEVLRMLRKSGYDGYVHLRLMPGVSRHLVREAVELADRVGVNLEGPDSEVFDEICPDKGDFETDLVKRLAWIAEEVARASPLERSWGRARAGVDTQFVVGAVPDTDEQYLKMTDRLYREFGLSRVYYSGFEPMQGTPLEGSRSCPPSREYRLYQASFLLRDYEFTFDDLRSILRDGFLPNMDPKLAYAQNSPELFPMDLNDAGRAQIMRIPGVGPALADAIVAAREERPIRAFKDLEEILGLKLARRVAPYVALQDRKLWEWSEPR